MPLSRANALLLTLWLAVITAGAAAAGQVDTIADEEVHDLLDLGLADRDAWYVRGFDSFFVRGDVDLDEAARGTPVRIDAAFLPYTGLRIRDVWILNREAFGTIIADTSATVMDDPGDTLATRMSPLGRALSIVAPGTRGGVIRNYLLFAEGDLIDPFALADSERMLRQLNYVNDAKIEVLPVAARPGWVDVAVLVRDRFPLGANAKIHTSDRYDLEIFHRNVAGLGLNLEVETPVERGKSPEVGWRARASQQNLGGSFVNVAAEVHHLWSRDRVAGTVDRLFDHPGIRLIGGIGVADLTDRDHPELPPGQELKTFTQDAWVGWGFNLREADAYGKRRVRFIPAVRIYHVDYRDPPLQFIEGAHKWRDATLYMGQLTLTGMDSYTSSLVFGYGETEDIPSGFWLGLTGGFENGERRDRLYHGISLFWPRFDPDGRLFAAWAGYGGFRRSGHFESGVLDLAVGGFGPLHHRCCGHWRHFYELHYTTGINRDGSGGLRLDEVALRDLDSIDVIGDQRLAAEWESVLFTRYALLGFRIASFGYAAGGFVGPEGDWLLDNRFSSNLGVGLRLRNPRLVINTIELRVGYLGTSAGTEPVITVRMGDQTLFRRDVPSAKPETLLYR